MVSRGSPLKPFLDQTFTVGTVCAAHKPMAEQQRFGKHSTVAKQRVAVQASRSTQNSPYRLTPLSTPVISLNYAVASALPLDGDQFALYIP